MADKAQGTTFSYKGTAVGQLTSISGPGISNPTVDVSSLDDVARKKISGGIVDGGQVTLGLTFDADDTMHDLIADDVIAGNGGACVLTFQNGTSATTTWGFTGFPTEMTPAINVGEAITADVTIDVSGTISIG